MNEELASQASVLKRHAFSFQGGDDLIVLSARYESVAKTSFGVPLVRITELKRKIEPAVRILLANVELAFWCASVTRLYFVLDRTQAQADAILSHDLSC